MATTVERVIHGSSLLTEHDVYLFRQGTHARLYEKLGAHPGVVKDIKGTHFAVWAPNAESVSVIGSFNDWHTDSHPLQPRADGSGIWEGFIPGVGHGTLYKYQLQSQLHGYRVEKTDPFAFRTECPPRTASIVWDLAYDWADSDWMQRRAQTNALQAPMATYEVHLRSWRRVPA